MVFAMHIGNIELATPLALAPMAGITDKPFRMLCRRFGAGLASPAALSSALSCTPGLVGAAAGLYGFGQMAMGAIGTQLVGYGSVPAVACAVTQMCITGLALASYRFAATRQQSTLV